MVRENQITQSKPMFTQKEEAEKLLTESKSSSGLSHGAWSCDAAKSKLNQAGHSSLTSLNTKAFLPGELLHAKCFYFILSKF